VEYPGIGHNQSYLSNTYKLEKRNAKIVLICKAPLNQFTPGLSLAHILANLVSNLTLITTSCKDPLKAELSKMGVKIIDLSKDTSRSTFFSRFKVWINFRKMAWNYLKGLGQNVLLWILNGDTTLALGRGISKFRYILQLSELYDSLPHYRKLLGFYASNASVVVVPDFCRAAILRCWYNLDKTPIVLPNKPSYHPRRRNLPITDQVASNTLSKIGSGKKIVIYQGNISPLRDIRPVAEAISRMGKQWQLVLMGENQSNFVEEVRKVNPKALYIPKIQSPHHLEVTSHAYIGVVVYGFDMLNAIFCAPNKIWEYSGFGIPMICLDIPCLRYTVGYAQAGLCSEMSDISNIVKCLEIIDNDYDFYQQNALRFFDSVDSKSIVSDIVLKVTRIC